jgi:probable HAF family extracellular repeat protein
MLHRCALTLTAFALLACDGTRAATEPIDPVPASQTLGKGNGFTTIGLLPGVVSASAYGVNNGGTIVGYGTTSTGTMVAFEWRRDGGMIEVPKPIGWGATIAFAVNDAGVIAGGAVIPSGATHAVTWSGGSPTDLGTLPGGSMSIAFNVNAQGQTVGYSDATASGGLPRAFLHTPGQGMRDLGALPGGVSSAAQDINTAGTVVGASYTYAGRVMAFKWTQSGGMTALPAVIGARESYALGINASGDVVGFVVMDADNRTRGVAWPSTGGVVQLQGLASNAASVAFDINDRGEITGYSEVNMGQRYRAVWWTPRTPSSQGWNVAVDLKVKANPESAYGQVISQGTAGQSTVVAGFASSSGVNTPVFWQ